MSRCLFFFHAWAEPEWTYTRARKPAPPDAVWVTRTVRCLKCPAIKSFSFATRDSFLPASIRPPPRE